MENTAGFEEKTHFAAHHSSHIEDGGPRCVVLQSFEELKDVRQGLKQRHIQMIALAGTIGTGLFLGSGQALAKSGPLGTLLSYSFTGSITCAVVMAVGEMGALLPLSGGYVRYSEFFLDRSASFAQGWNMVYSYLVAIPAEIVAAAVLVDFWVSVNNAVWITTFGVIMLISTLLLVRVYGELEFVFALLKIALIIGINIMALVITCGGGPSDESIGFRYWRNPGPFVQYFGWAGATGRFAGFWTTFTNALYAYASVETISLAAAETQNPRKAIPKAAKRIFIRTILFYVLTIFMVGLVVPSDDPNLLQSNGNASQSPFVIAARRAGIKVVPGLPILEYEYILEYVLAVPFPILVLASTTREYEYVLYIEHRCGVFLLIALLSILTARRRVRGGSLQCLLATRNVITRISGYD